MGEKKQKYQGFLYSQEATAGFWKELSIRYSEECSESIIRARRLLSGTFLFENEWDMERTFLPEQLLLDQIDWNYKPNGDPEWTYMLNRHVYLTDVAIAYQLTGNQEYARFYERLLTDWIKNNPINTSTRLTSWRTIDAGIRLNSWVKTLEIFLKEDDLTEAFIHRIRQSIREHLVFLKDHRQLDRCQSNWAVLEENGIFLAQAFLGEIDMFEFDILLESLRLQILPDGLQWEQSFMYHHEVFLAVLEVLLIAERNGCCYPLELRNVLHKMQRASLKIMTPVYEQPNFGDSDVENMNGLLDFADCVLDTEREAKSFFAAVRLGNCGSPQLLPLASERETHHFPYNGLSVVKDNKQKRYLLFKCGPLGGGHGHDDLLHFEWMIDGKKVLVDSGRYSYEVVQHGRLAFKEAAAHNTILINKMNFNAHEDAWDTTKVATSLGHRLCEGKNIVYIEGAHLGYFFNEQILLKRQIIYLESGMIFIFDQFWGRDDQMVEQHFHFNTEKAAIVNKTQVNIQQDGLEFGLLDISESAEISIENCEISEYYNQKRVVKQAIFSQKIGVLNSCIGVVPCQNEQPMWEIEKVAVYNEEGLQLADTVVTCLLLQRGQKKSYVLVAHLEDPQSRKTYFVAGNRVFGRIVYFELDDQNQISDYEVLD